MLFKPNIEALKKRKNIEGLIKALRNRDTFVQVDAAKALSEMGDPRAVEPLIKALEYDIELQGML